VIPSGQNPHKMWKIDKKSGLMQGLLRVDNIEEPYNAPRQILPETFWQTGHIDAIRPSVIQEKHSMSGKRILPVMVDPDYTVDIDKPSDWQRAEWLVWYGGLKMVTPGNARRDLPKKIDLIVFDFDGVMTNNLVYVNQDGVESIAANRSDGMGIVLLRKSGIKAMVLSTETNPVVQVRCKKLKLPVIQGVENKDIVLRDYLKTNDIDPNNVIFVGNDVNDVSCFSIVGCALAVADAHPIALRQADVILKHNGGDGAVREVCDLVMKTQSR
jgi:N-acylneuraminate cytidylyltransferase